MAISRRPTYNDLELAGKVRKLALNQIYEYLQDSSEDNKEFKKALLLRMSANLLPRLNEHSGPDGGEIPIPIYGGASVRKDESTQL